MKKYQCKRVQYKTSQCTQKRCITSTLRVHFEYIGTVCTEFSIWEAGLDCTRTEIHWRSSAHAYKMSLLHILNSLCAKKYVFFLYGEIYLFLHKANLDCPKMTYCAEKRRRFLWVQYNILSHCRTLTKEVEYERNVFSECVGRDVRTTVYCTRFEQK
jgi:hypothetical protein